jgi:hypothetical protein
MSTGSVIDEHDPYAAHFHREPLPGAAVRVILITSQNGDSAEAVLAPLTSAIAGAGRVVETRTVQFDQKTSCLRDVYETALQEPTSPLVLVTTATEPWSAAHLEPLLNTIDICDHVVGRRRVGYWRRFLRTIGSLPRRLLFAVPVIDVHSPCQLHRAEKLAAIALQSSSSFLDVEMLAKATFLGHLLGEVEVPPLRGRKFRTGWWSDLIRVLKRPEFRSKVDWRSGPLEDAKCDSESNHSPGGEDQ